jgi:hypothetical protein
VEFRQKFVELSVEGLDMLVHTCNLSSPEAEIGKMAVQDQPEQKVSKTHAPISTSWVCCYTSVIPATQADKGRRTVIPG